MNLSRQKKGLYVFSFAPCLRLTGAVWVALLAARGFRPVQVELPE